MHRIKKQREFNRTQKTLSVHPSACLSISFTHRPAHHPIYTESPCLSLSLFPSATPCLSLFLSPSPTPCLSLSLSPSPTLPVSPSLSPSPTLPVSPSLCLPLYLQLSLSLPLSPSNPPCLSLSLPLTLPVSPSLSPTIHVSPSLCLPLWLSLSLPLFVSLTISPCLSLSVSNYVSLAQINVYSLQKRERKKRMVNHVFSFSFLCFARPTWHSRNHPVLTLTFTMPWWTCRATCWWRHRAFCVPHPCRAVTTTSSPWRTSASASRSVRVKSRSSQSIEIILHRAFD